MPPVLWVGAAFDALAPAVALAIPDGAASQGPPPARTPVQAAPAAA